MAHVAAEMGISRPTAYKWVNRWRAEGQAEEADLPVEAIAARVGLTSAVNLRRRFRDQVGTTPGAYRRAFRFS